MNTPMKAQRTQIVHPAGFISRAVALLLDLVIIAAITGLTLAAINLLSDFFRATLFNTIVRSTQLQNIYYLLWGFLNFVLTYVLILVYFAGCWSLVGFTPGMYLVGLRVVHKNGELPGFLRGLARIFLFTLSALPLFLGFLWVIFDNKRQAWHDKIVGTYVVYMDLPGNEDSPYIAPPLLGQPESVQSQSS